ncbi:MAG: alpha/beta hydrolase family protein [Fimbriimonadaceae bacterium]
MIIAFILVAISLGQDLKTIPAPINFDERKLVSSDEENFSEYSASFSSPLTTAIAENNTVPVSLFLPKNVPTPMPVSVVLHYLGASDLRVERAMATDLAQQGVATLIVVLPYHLQRSPKGVRSGELAIQPDPSKLIETMTQSVLDVRRAVDFIERQPELDSNRIGLAGTSLGSIVAALAYAVDTRFKVVAFMLGGADLAHILWSSSRVGVQREILRGKGYNEERLREALISIEPLTYLKGREPAPSLAIGAKYDTVIPPEDTRKLIAALPDCQSVWLDTGHYGGIFVQHRIIRTVTQFLARRLKNETFKIPASLAAPTLRVGATVDTDSGFQVAIGLDLWKANRHGSLFSSLIITPRGPALFFGAKVHSNISIGVMAKPRRISPGILWSIVL